MSTLLLPTDEDALVEVLRSMIEEGRRARIPNAIEWYINFHYLRGARYFDSVDYKTGTVVAFYEDLLGEMPFKFEDVLAKYSAEVGRLVRLDVWPMVDRNALSLTHCRQAATAHVVLDTLMRSQPMDTIKKAIAEHLCLYGTVGLTNWAVSEPNYYNPDEPDIQNSANAHILSVVPPWEIYPLPPSPTHPQFVKAIARRRWVPYEWLATMSLGQKNLRLPAVEDQKLDAIWAYPEYLQSPDSPRMSPLTPPPVPSGATPTMDGPSRGIDKMSDQRRGVANVLLTEIWITNATGKRLDRYIVTVGRRVLHDINYEEMARKPKRGEQPTRPPVMPFAVSQYFGGLGFFGRSFLGPQISLNAEVEHMLLQLFRNVQDLDQFGYLFLPSTWGIPDDALFEAKPGRKIFQYNPDPVSPALGIHTAQPVTAGELPGKTATMGLSLLDRMAGQPTDIMRGDVPGRLESAKGLDVLYQTAAVPLGGAAISIAEMFSRVYASVLWNTRAWPSLRINLLSLIDDQLAGIVFDPETGRMAMENNNIPDPDSLVITIKSKEPIDTDGRKMELLNNLKLGIITPMEYRLINRREGLGMFTGNEVEWANYVHACLNSILWFGDGKTPGQAFTTDFDVPAIHEYVCLRRIASPEFALASPAVQSKFIERIKTLRALRGAYPDQMPYPEEAAQFAMQAGTAAEGPAPGSPGAINPAMALGGASPAGGPGSGGMMGSPLTSLAGLAGGGGPADAAGGPAPNFDLMASMLNGGQQ